MDNIFKEGSFITAKENPQRKLIINKYYKRIYYCHIVDDSTDKLLVYFEKDLIAPLK
jgi:hypothetical protein